MRASILKAIPLSLILLLSLAEAAYFSGATFLDSGKVLDSMSLYAPFQPVAIMYAWSASPLLGVPLNVGLFALLLYSSRMFTQRPVWQKALLFAVEWLVITALATWFMLKAVWGV